MKIILASVVFFFTAFFAHAQEYQDVTFEGKQVRYLALAPREGAIKTEFTLKNGEVALVMGITRNNIPGVILKGNGITIKPPEETQDRAGFVIKEVRTPGKYSVELSSIPLLKGEEDIVGGAVLVLTPPAVGEMKFMVSARCTLLDWTFAPKRCKDKDNTLEVWWEPPKGQGGPKRRFVFYAPQAHEWANGK